MRKRIYFVIPAVLIAGIVIAFGSIWAQDAAQDKRKIAEAQFTSAQSDQKALKWLDANAKFKQIIAADPDSPVAHRARIQVGKYHKYHRDWQTAIDYYREVVRRSPHTREAQDAITAEAAIHYFRQDFPLALELFKEVLADTQDWDQVKYCSFWIKEVERKLAYPQENQFSCGKESIKIALGILGISCNEKELDSFFKDKNTMLSLLDLNEAAAKKGLKPMVVKVTAGDIENLDTPFIASVEPEHYVVVTKARDGAVTFIDPAEKRTDQKKTLGKFAQDFKGYALIFLKDKETLLAKANRFPQPSERELLDIKGGVCTCCPPNGLGGQCSVPNLQYDHGGCGSCSPEEGEPSWSVNTINFNFVLQATSFSYASRGMPVSLTLTYNSDDNNESVFGRSWTFNYNMSLVENPDSSIDIRRGDAKIDHFFWNGSVYQGPNGIYDTLVKNGDSTYTLTLKGTKTKQNFSAQGKLTSIVDRNGNTISLGYTGSNLTTVTDPNSRQITLTYTNGKVTRVALPDGRHADYVYDASNNLIQATSTTGQTSTFGYDIYSYMTSMTTPKQGTTAIGFEFGTAHHLGSITDALGNTRRYSFVSNGEVTKITDSKGGETVFHNAYPGFTQSITAPGGATVVYSYDALGNRNETMDTFGKTTYVTYDGSGNPTLIRDTLGHNVTMAYDATNDTLTSITDPKNNIYNFTYDNKTNLISVRAPVWNETNFTYNAYGQLMNLTDANGSRTDFAYDAGGNLTQMRDPLGKLTNYTYDAYLRLSSLTDSKGQRFNYTYDNASHMTNVTFNGTMANYTYTCCNLVQAQDAAGTLNFTYDSIGRTTSFTNQDNKTILYEYDSAGSLVNLTYPGNHTVNYQYDVDNRLIKVTDWLGHNTTYNYDIGGRVTSGVSPGLITIYKYDDAGRLLKLMNYNTNGTNTTITSSFEYSMDDNSNRELIKRLIPLSNATFNITNTTYSYNADNQLLSAGGQNYTYDDNGNMLSITANPAINLTYNPLNQLTQYTSATNMTFQYDALGNRIKKVSGGVTTKYVVSGSSVYAETDAGGTITSYYIYGLGLVGKIDASTNNTYYYQYDGLGSTVATTDVNGTIKNKYAYDDFGAVSVNSTETIGNSFKYVGKYGVQTDAPDLLNMRARYYMPSMGRFINHDPIGFGGGINQYSYVGNNPINLVDPSGLRPPNYIPPGVSPKENSEIAEKLRPTVWIDFVSSGGIWDYKKLSDSGVYEAFGNYNYGLTGRALGIPGWILRRGAGYYQCKSGTSKLGWGSPWGSSPYGDDPVDQYWIDQGIQDYDSGYWE